MFNASDERVLRGPLTGKYKSYDDVLQRKEGLRDKVVLFQKDIFPHALEVVKLVEEIAEKYRRTPGQVALRWLLHQDSVTTVIVGARNICQLEDNLGAIGWDLEDEDWKRLNKRGKEVAELLDYSVNMWGYKYYRGIK